MLGKYQLLDRWGWEGIWAGLEAATAPGGETEPAALQPTETWDLLVETDELVLKRASRPFWAWQQVLIGYNSDTNSNMWDFPRTTPASLSDTSWVSENSTQFWHHLPGDNIRPHRLMAQ